MSLVYLIDGTGDRNEDDYKKAMSGSFCSRIAKKTNGNYYRGPTVDGLGTFDIAKVALGDLIKNRAKDPTGNIFLVGHSRGGAAAIYMAAELKKLRIPVAAMFLYDAVDRTLSFSNLDKIPGNVKLCYHARRDTSLKNYYEAGVKQALKQWDDCLQANRSRANVCTGLGKRYQDMLEQDLKMKRAMRSSGITGLDVPGLVSIDFGNCGTSAESGCKYEEQLFLGSHGAIGGAPIIDETAPRLLIESDRAAIASVEAWMSARLLQVGVLKA